MWFCGCILLLLLVLVCGQDGPGSACPNDCSRHGACTKYTTCDCFQGYEGNDCSRKSCPKGASINGIPYALDLAHKETECSGQGLCDSATGLCACYEGYTGHNCARTMCMNDCSGRGRCISMRMAAEENDGFQFSHTTVYDRWDADRIFGCKCDYGYIGADCSQRNCEYGVDPRVTDVSHETVTFVCDCRYGCDGRFKLRFMGYPAKTWLHQHSTIQDLVNVVMATPGIYKDSGAYTHPPVYVDNFFTNDSICVGNGLRKIPIKFRKNVGDLPAMSFYANTFPKVAYFETTQTLLCDCTGVACNGTYRVSFESEMSPKLPSWTNGTELLNALKRMATVKAGGYVIKSLYGFNGPLCAKDSVGNVTVLFQGNQGNAPKMGLWSSVVFNNVPEYYTTSNTSNVLTLITNDGREDSVKLCNGIGKCDYSTGFCTCPYGWGADPDLGPCGALVTNTSLWSGVARCPGIVTMNSVGVVDKDSQDRDTNHMSKIYVSLDAVDFNDDDGNKINSTIWVFIWRPETIRGARLDTTDADSKQFLTLTSHQSAGPIVIDAPTDRLFFIDNNPAQRFIGVASQYSTDTGNFTIWHSLSYEVFGFALDAHFARRRLYWSAPKALMTADGQIYYASIDDAVPVIHTLTSIVGQQYVVSPMGLAVHFQQKRLYWVDRDLTEKHSVLRSCKFDGSDYKQSYMFRRVNNRTISMNLTDLVLHITNNNSAIMLDAKFPASIVSLNLDSPVQFNTKTDEASVMQNENYYQTRTIVKHSQRSMTTPRYLTVDDYSYIVMWSDYDRAQIGYSRYRSQIEDVYSPGVTFTGIGELNYRPVGMRIDRGLGAPRWGSYLSCYGNGVCKGLEGNYVCECYDGFFGDCQARMCPKGKAWFHEPVVDNIAHDEFVECSNMGVCSRGTGTCTCKAGFEGPACERMSCPSNGSDVCINSGRCMSLRQLAAFNRDEYLDPKPVEYGSRVNDADTWDADMIYACLPDEYGNYYGIYNVSNPTGPRLDRFVCPVGFNKRFADKMETRNGERVSNYTMEREVQQIICDADHGYFTLSFRGDVTPKIYADYTAAQFKTALEELPSLGKIDVEFSHSRICSSSGVFTAKVTFISHLGLIPLFKSVDTSNLSGGENKIYVSRVQQCRAENLYECAGHGKCDFNDGLCHCFQNYGSSDGLGNLGTVGDCGYFLRDK